MAIVSKGTPFDMPLNLFTNSACLGIACAIAFTTPSMAEKPFPLQEDITLHEHLPNEMSFDIRGFKLLTNPETIEALKSAFPESDYGWQLRSETRGLKDGRGNSVSFAYGPTSYAIKSNKQGYEKYHVHFTSGLLGNKVYSVDLNTTFPEQVDLNSMIKAFEGKFGKPSLTGGSFGKYELAYLFENGEQIFSDFEVFQTNRYRDPDAKRVSDCLASRSIAPAVGSFRPYRFKENRERRYPQCSGGVYVSLRLGAREDLVQQMIIHIWDGDLAYKNQTTQDQFLLQQLLGDKADRTGAAAPKL